MPSFPWSRTGSVKGTNGEKPKAAKRRSSHFLSFSEKKDKAAGVGSSNGATNGNNEANGTSNGATNGHEATSAPKPGVLDRAATSLLPDHNQHRPEVESTFEQFADVIKASMRPMPTTGDGLYHEDKKEPSAYGPT